MPSGLEEIAAKKGAELVIEHVVPRVTDYGKMLWSGRRFLILGPPRCGKTSFLNYLEYLILSPQRPTPTTVGVHKGKDRILKLGPEGRLILRIRKPRDVPGQLPIHQIPYIEDYVPHCIVVVLDATTFFGVPPADSSLEWLRQFCLHLDILLTSNKKVAKKLKSMTVVMNKWDKIAAAAKQNARNVKEVQEAFEAEVRKIIDTSLHNQFYVAGGVRAINVLPCCLVSNTAEGESLARELVQSVAMSLSTQ
jgi:hypothetical protein